jgi:hypothetical protein
MSARIEGELTVNAAGVQVTSAGASARVAIPATADGNTARHLRIQALASAYVRPCNSTGTATANDILVTPNEQVVLNVQGFTHIAYIQETAAAKINFTPLEVG